MSSSPSSSSALVEGGGAGEAGLVAKAPGSGRPLMPTPLTGPGKESVGGAPHPVPGVAAIGGLDDAVAGVLGDGHREVDRLSEVPGQGRGDAVPQAALDRFLGELRRGGQQRGGAQQAHRLGQGQPRPLLLGQRGFQVRHDRPPHREKMVVAFLDDSLADPLHLCRPRTPSTGIVHRCGQPRENGKRPARRTAAGIGLLPGDSVIPSRCGRDANNFLALATRPRTKQGGPTACRDLAGRCRSRVSIDGARSGVGLGSGGGFDPCRLAVRTLESYR